MTSKLLWFSSTLGIAIITEPDGLLDYCYCVIAYSAEDWDAAKQIAINYGNKFGKKYTNSKNNLVVWKFHELVTLDILKNFNCDQEGVIEICWHYAATWPQLDKLKSDNSWDINTAFSPETAEPTQSL